MKKLDAELVRLLQRTLGLNAQAASTADVNEAVQCRMQDHGVRSRARYLSILRCSRGERRRLVESIALPHVGFFQEQRPFEALQRWILQHWLPRPSKKPLRLLSVPCATGEEPYSLAITLLELGLHPHQFHVDAVDINDRALRMAAGAIYSNGATETASETIRERYFQREQNGFRLCPSVRAQVSFLKTDILGDVPLNEDYDIIFGRSLMVYFTEPAQDRILKQLQRLLKPGGLLVVGPREPGLQKRGTVPNWASVMSSVSTPLAKANGAVGSKVVRPLSPAVEKVRLRQAKALLERQCFNEATAICVNVLADHRASAQAICLLGRIAQAEGRNVEAREYYRRAIYLQPRLRQAQQLLTHCPPWLKPRRRRK
jgi:chemotaxis protein methyltransferase WspC